MKYFLVIDFNKNTCELEPHDMQAVGVKNLKQHKTQKELLDTVKEYLRNMKEEE